ncbi:MAG TPA: ATPase, T2SS/T4P/T4SS family [Kofleriaceae bacterium]|nr:ATPase, T2SS/T4P/T4SS family [Kofleriaceae bacterium]
MSRLDVYLRSIEKFGATGAILTSGQAVTLRFPTGDRHATQVTPHEQIVALVREVAPASALDSIDKHRAARFDYESGGHRYALTITPRPGAWQVAIDGAPATAAAPPAPAATFRTPSVAPPAAAAPAVDMLIERGQYDAPADPVRAIASGSTLLDELTRAARAARASDLFLHAGAPPLQRTAGELAPASGNAIDGDQLARELGVVAPPEARAAWSESGAAVFAYGDGAGRVRVTLGRDHRGPCAALRLLPDEPPALDLGIDEWLGFPGLVLVAGPSGAGKTVTLAAIVRRLGERGRRVVVIEDPIELVHASPMISQRAVGPHVASFEAGVHAAMSEGADAIAIAEVRSAAIAGAIVDAVAGGHLVVASVAAPVAAVAFDRLIGALADDRREAARTLFKSTYLGAIRPLVQRGNRTFEVLRAG